MILFLSKLYLTQILDSFLKNLLTHTEYIAVLLLSFLSFLTTGLGVLMALCLKRNDLSIAIGIGFSTGIMLLLSFAELIPEAIQTSGLQLSLFSVSAGAVLLWLLHIILPHTHLIKEPGLIGRTALKSVYLVVIGLILHDIPEGFAMANAYISAPSLGVLVAVGIALHNLPEEFALCMPIITIKNKRFLITAALLSALAEPFGAIAGLLAIDMAPGLTPVFLAFASGGMIFISVHELIPLARRYGSFWHICAGFMLSWAVYELLKTVIPAVMNFPVK